MENLERLLKKSWIFKSPEEYEPCMFGTLASSKLKLTVEALFKKRANINLYTFISGLANLTKGQGSRIQRLMK